MKSALLEFLACPFCRSDLELTVALEQQFQCKEIMEGHLQCKSCKKIFPIVEGIPRFVQKVSIDPTQERFSYEWMRYPGSLPEDREIFLYETQIPAEEWNGKKILDAGCGMGRYSRVAHELGSAVIAMDLGTALIRLWDLAKTSDRLHIVQGDLMSPPFKENVFDIVYSIGVIHHTPSAYNTFKQLVKLVCPQGKLSVWVYGAPGSFGNFKTNPLKQDRQGLKKYIFLVWLIVWIREKISNTLRLITVYLAHWLVYWICYPLAWIGNIPLIKYLTFSVHPVWRVRLQENFDWLSPPYQSHHTKEELKQWFEESGFEVLKILPHGFVPKPGILGIRVRH